MKKMTATVDRDPSSADSWIVVVTETDTGRVHNLTITADTEMDAAFKAMELANDR